MKERGKEVSVEKAARQREAEGTLPCAEAGTQGGPEGDLPQGRHGKLLPPGGHRVRIPFSLPSSSQGLFHESHAVTDSCLFPHHTGLLGLRTL